MTPILDDTSDGSSAAEFPPSKNPFSYHRAEHFGNDLHRYFARPDLFSGRLSAKSLVVMGGRGCGKTMFFMYHTYESKSREHYDDQLRRSRVLEREGVLGVYVHAESDVVTAFAHRNMDTDAWIRLFGHYLNLRIAQGIARIVADVAIWGEIDRSIEAAICADVSFALDLQPEVASYPELSGRLARAELEVLRYIGNPLRFAEPVLSVHGSLPKKITTSLTADRIFAGKVFHVFVDEYENLLEYQQRVVNTLIKTPSPSLVVDIGLRREGWKTRQTLAEHESISAPHDFNLAELETMFSLEDYLALLRETCRKRFTVFDVPHVQRNGFDSHAIDSYLGEYNLRTEVDRLLSGKKAEALSYKQEIGDILRERAATRDEAERLHSVLAHGRDELINRLNLCLLLQRKKPEVLETELKKHTAGERSRYREWLHNYAFGVVFLLCRDLRMNKRYFGFTAFALISSGTIRYFLELCENAFVVATRNGFSFDDPRPLTPEEQDRAAQAVSARKVDEVDSYTPFGSHLKKMLSVLGAVFSSLHEDKRVSEPERNHFTTRMEDLTETASAVLRSAVLWNVVQEREATKDKRPSDIGAEKEYHLNHIYSPYFQISYRRKRSLFVRPELLNAILAGDLRDAKAAGRTLISQRAVTPVAELEPDTDFPTAQAELWISSFERADE